MVWLDKFLQSPDKQSPQELPKYVWLWLMIYYEVAVSLLVIFANEFPSWMSWNGFSLILLAGVFFATRWKKVTLPIFSESFASIRWLMVRVLLIGLVPNMFLLGIGLLIYMVSSSPSLSMNIGYWEGKTMLRLLVLAPLSEELFFRGLVYRSLKKKLSNLGAGYVSAVLFSLAHVTLFFPDLIKGIVNLNVGLPIGPFLLGLLCAYLYEKSGHIWLVILVHSAFNFTGPLMQRTFPFMLDLLKFLY